MRSFSGFSLLLALLFSFEPNIGAAKSHSTPHIHVSLVSEDSSLASGKDNWVGFRFEIERDWHLYWKNPGDSGDPPRVEWTLPSGITAGKIQWPSPKRIPVGHLANFGYSDSLLLAVPLRVSSDMPRGNLRTIPIRALLKWLVCRDVCTPGESTLTLNLPISSQKQEPTDWAPLFAQNRQNQPQDFPEDWKVASQSFPDFFEIKVEGPESKDLSEKNPEVFFYPEIQNQIENAAPQKVDATSDIILRIKKSDQLTRTPARLQGILQIQSKFYQLDSPLNPLKESQLESGSFFSWITAIFGAFLGGLILNLMPCVFPVLSIKALSLLQGAHSKKSRTAKIQALIYTLGILVSFWIFALITIALRSTGEKIGWGFQLQSPLFIVLLSNILFLMGLNLLGFFEINHSFTGMGNKLTLREGNWGSFFTGVLTTWVATPCTAPFMGTALGFAVTQSAGVILAVFTAVGIGLASPYCLFSFSPSLASILPKPGRWMETFKEVMAFPLLGTVIWLAWVLGTETDLSAVAALLLGLLFLSIAVWVLHRWKGRGAFLAVFILLGLAFWIEYTGAHSGTLKGSLNSTGPKTSGQKQADSWQNFSRSRYLDLLHSGKPFFLDFTAAWCITCKVNEALAFTPSVMKEMAIREVTPIRGDWTNSDPEITKTLEEFGRNGVPLYVFYSGRKNENPTVLPQILTPQTVLDELNKTEPRR